jgi:exosortase/archaeosortase family protein
LISFFCAALLAFPCPLGRRMIGLLAGIVAIALFNVVRIASVFLVGVYQPKVFQAVHEDVWPGLMVMITLLLLLAWIRWATRSDKAKPVPFFAGRFVIIFCLALVPWPGFSRQCGNVLRSLGATVFTTSAGQREVKFEAPDSRNTRAVIVNRALMNPDGSGPVRNLDFNSCGFLWRPLSLLLVLIFATPMSLRCQMLSLALGGYCLLGCLLIALGFAIWNESTAVSLVTLSPFWKDFADQLQVTLVQLATLAAPVFVWLWAVFPWLQPSVQEGLRRRSPI